MVPQDATERLLVEELGRKGGGVEYGTTLLSAVQHDSYVSATLDQNGKWTEMTAAFVVGCDGAHSTVRHLLNLPFEAAQYDASFMLADVETNEALLADQLAFSERCRESAAMSFACGRPRPLRRWDLQAIEKYPRALYGDCGSLQILAEPTHLSEKGLKRLRVP